VGPPDCTCALTVPRCDACLRQALYYQSSTAWVRGENWAKSVAARVGTDRPWPPYEGKVVDIARSKIKDSASGDERITDALARECHRFAERTWEKIRGATVRRGGR
jgi:hypothetical protein